MVLLPNEESWKSYVSNNTNSDDCARKPVCYPCFAYKTPVGMNGNSQVAYLYRDDIEKMAELMKLLSSHEFGGQINE